ncbi:MAG: hypothetical protein JNJ46_23050 [Myxococcales bacterium]|nr:hypothetical protein [Myxococcales bacterium]
MSSQKHKRSAPAAKEKRTASPSFKQTVTRVPALAEAFRPGLQALIEQDRKRLTSGDLATGSIDLDGTLRRQHPQDRRWDYGIGVHSQDGPEHVLWLEVHHAASGEAQAVVEKFAAMKGWLQQHAPALWALPKVVVWLVSGGDHNPNDRRRRTALAEKHGIRRVSPPFDLARLQKR